MSLAENAPAQPPTPGRTVATLARELADFLVEFSIVLHKRAMYPSGHPHLQDSAERFVNRLEALLQSRGALALGVARNQLILGGAATDPRNALLSDLARRLHRHRIATVRFEPGIMLREIDELLGSLSADPHGADGPFGLRPGAGASWAHLQVQPPELNRLLLQEDDGDSTAPAAPGGELWIGLANLALAGDGVSPSDADDPLIVARAIDAQSDQGAYDRVVLDYLGQIAEEMSGRAGAWEPRIRERVSHLVTSLKPETLRRVLEAGADHEERRQFALTAAEVLAVDAVVEVVEAAASTTGQTISHHLLRLLHKFAQHAERGPEATRAEAESMLRQNVARLITDWELEDPNPGNYTAVLDAMVRQSPGGPTEAPESLDCDPATVLQLALETGYAGPRALAALDALVAERRLPEAAELLREAPDDQAAGQLWRHIATPVRLREELAAAKPHFPTIEGLVSRLHMVAAEPLLDVLEQTTSLSTRARAVRLLVSIGPMAAAPAAARLPKAPWFVQRNLLMVLRQLRVWPPGFSAVSYAMHPEPRLRREAFRLLLEFPMHRASAITHGLGDPDERVVSLVLRGALESCPTEAVKPVERFIADGRRPAELRALAVRVLGRAGGPNGLPRLMELAGARRYLFFGWRLEGKSPVSLAAVSALARYWGGHPEVTRFLAVAREHEDAEVRGAAAVRFA